MTDGAAKRAPGGVERRRLADGLRALRLAADLSTTQLAKEMGWSQSKVSKIETGRTRPAPADVRAWASRLRANPAEVDELVEIAIRAANQVATWRASHAGGLTRRQREYASMEAGITQLRNFQHGIVPGLLQTPDYARHILTMMDVTAKGDVATAVAARLDRQTILFDETKTFRFALTEAALRWRPGTRDQQRAQMDRLLNLSEQPNISLTVIPLDAPAALPYLSGFAIFSAGTDVWVGIELQAAEMMISEAEEVGQYLSAFQRLEESGVQGQDAARIIKSIGR